MYAVTSSASLRTAISRMTARFSARLEEEGEIRSRVDECGPFLEVGRGLVAQEEVLDLAL